MCTDTSFIEKNTVIFHKNKNDQFWVHYHFKDIPAPGYSKSIANLNDKSITHK